MSTKMPRPTVMPNRLSTPGLRNAVRHQRTLRCSGIQGPIDAFGFGRMLADY